MQKNSLEKHFLNSIYNNDIKILEISNELIIITNKNATKDIYMIHVLWIL